MENKDIETLGRIRLLEADSFDLLHQILYDSYTRRDLRGKRLNSAIEVNQEIIKLCTPSIKPYHKLRAEANIRTLMIVRDILITRRKGHRLGYKDRIIDYLIDRDYIIEIKKTP